MPPPPPPTTQAAPSTLARGADVPLAMGRWTLSVAVTDDIGQTSEMTQVFTVNTTLGFLSTAPRKLYLPPLGRDLAITWRQGRAARVVVTVENSAGEVVRTLARRRYDAGERGVIWNGLGRDRKAVKGGKYLVRVVARNQLGPIELARYLRVQRIVGPPAPKPRAA